MPFGLPFPEGASAPGPEGADPTITRFFDAARARLEAQDFSAIFNNMLNAVQARPAPAPQPVPPPVHPIGRIASTFAATFAEQLGARGAGAANDARIAMREAEAARITAANQIRQDQFEHQQASDELRIMMAINSAKMEQAKAMNSLDEYEARLKTASQLRRQEAALNEQAKLRYIQASNEAIMKRVLATTKEQGEQARKTVNYKELLKTAVGTVKASEGLKLWGRARLQEAFAKDGLTGEYLHTEQEREAMMEESYTEFLRKLAEEKAAGSDSTGTTATTGGSDFFDSIFGD